MTNPMRRALENADFDNSRTSQLFRNSLIAAEKKFFTPRESLLTVEIEGGGVDAYTSSQVAMAVIDSASMFAKSIKDPKAASVRRNPTFRESLGFRNLGSSGNRLYLGFPEPKADSERPLIDRRESPGLAEASIKSLAQVLPIDDQDDQALDAAQALLVPQRIGLHTLSETLAEISRSIELNLKISDGSSMIGQLSADQAIVLRSSLAKTKRVEERIRRTGVLDGMRTRRQVFYLDSDSHGSISGAVDERVLRELPTFIGKRVTVDLIRYQSIQKSGRRSKPAYRLTGVRPAADPFSELTGD